MTEKVTVPTESEIGCKKCCIDYFVICGHLNHEAQPEQTEPLDLSKVSARQKGLFGSSISKEIEEITNSKNLSIQEENEKKGINYHERQGKLVEIGTLNQTEEKMHNCLECGKNFKKLQYLKSHSQVHISENLCLCDRCGMRFLRLSNLRFHLHAHTGEKPFVCEVCGKDFSQSLCLKRHMRIHTKEQPYKCSKCERSFNHPSNFIRHMHNIHDRTKLKLCFACGKGFPHLYRLKQHMLTHTKEKPHSCELCGKKFSLSASLKRHKKNHCKRRSDFNCTISG
uniref:C2H2-type domain-containing protein n=1 Tax=Onchocerca volvulus TaxID=6282 RepID=A0A8R1TM59_ONCVO